MSAYMDDMISEVTYEIKKGLIFLGATTVNDKLHQRKIKKGHNGHKNEKVGEDGLRLHGVQRRREMKLRRAGSTFLGSKGGQHKVGELVGLSVNPVAVPEFKVGQHCNTVAECNQYE
nr:hypothetical protein [Tanacetum cinerariifolium]